VPGLPRPLSLPIVEPPAPLCRAGGHSCAGCCYGEALPRAAVERALARHTSLFSRSPGDNPPGPLRLLLHELRARGLAGLLWALALLLPGVGGAVRPWLRRRSVCAFLGYLDLGRRQVGCLLHPSRHGGRDVRRRSAFALWLGFGCGEADWLCLPGWRWARADWRARRDFLRAAEGLDWFDFGRAVARAPWLSRDRMGQRAFGPGACLGERSHGG
jgi:hypothetical protein